MCVDLVLQQRGAGGGAAPADVALFDHRHIVAMVGQLVGDQRAGNAAADHQHVAAQVLLQRREGVDQAVAYCPPRVATLQVHARRSSGSGVAGVRGLDQFGQIEALQASRRQIMYLRSGLPTSAPR
ncbi:hypothetical protein G6F40_016375 [Rhizopus arrhizus]|nr:hypothetical protein G6F40_016375 [Rhizopus arrhizus]